MALSVDDFFNEIVQQHECMELILRRRDFNALNVFLPSTEAYCHILFTFIRSTELEDLRQLLTNLYMLYDSYMEIVSMLQANTQNDDSCYVCPTLNSQRGRPRYNITQEQLFSLRTSGFTWTDMCQLLNVSASTLQRHRSYCDFIEPKQVIPCEELDRIICEILSNTPNAGERYVFGSITSRNIKVSRQRVRDRLKVINPIQIAARRSQAIIRRVYNVKGSNHLWHMDSNHKLVNFRFVYHCAVDGFSRCIIYLECLTNNTATSVLELFKKGVRNFGLPKRVRGDHGTENLFVAEYMIHRRGLNRGSFITGRSVHNVRVERLWAEVNRVVTKPFKELFILMEEQNILDELDEGDLLALKFIFLPRIHRSLAEFVNQWNHHHLRTMGGSSPFQLWQRGMIIENNGLSAENNEDTNEESHISENQITDIVTRNNVTIPQFFDNHLNFEQQLYNIVQDPLEDDGRCGVNLYLQIRHYIRTSFRTYP